MAALGTVKDAASVVKASLNILKSCMSAAERLVSNHIRISIEDALMESRFDMLLADIRSALATVGRLDRIFGLHAESHVYISQQDTGALENAVMYARARVKAVITRAEKYLPGEEHAAEVLAEAQRFLSGEHDGASASGRNGSKVGRFLKKVHRAWKPEVYEGHWADLQQAVRYVQDACEQLLAVGGRVRSVRRQPQYVPPPEVFNKVVDALLEPSVRVVVLWGPPALGKSALAKQVLSLACSRGDLAEAIQHTAYYLCRGGYLCDVAGKPSRLPELYSCVTEAPWDEALQHEEYVAGKLVEHLGHAFKCTLLILDGLEDGSECFSEGATLAQLPGSLIASKLLITSCSEAVCRVLERLAECRFFTLQRADNQRHVMHKLMQRLMFRDGSSEREVPEWLQRPDPRDRQAILVCHSV